MSQRGLASSWPHVLLLVVLAVYAWLALGYGSGTPAWENPDEPAHYNYVAEIATAGRLPVLQPGDWDADLLDRLKASQFRSADPIATIRYEAWQPPLYYLAAAPVYRVFSSSQVARVQALRTFDVVLGGLTVVVVYVAALQLFVWAPIARVGSIPLTGRRLLAVAAAAVVVGVPMFTAMSAAINNDALANLLAAVLLALMLRQCCQSYRTRDAVVSGLLVGLALLTKLTLAPFGVLAVGVALLGAYRSSDRARQALLAACVCGGSALLVLSPWLIRQGVVYGWDDLLATHRHDSVVVGQPRTPPISAQYALDWSTTTFHSFWAQFGWMGVPAPDRLYWIWGAFLLVGGVGAVLWLVAQRPRLWPWRTADWRVPLLVLACLSTIAALLYYNVTFQQPQGRYLFPALLPFAVLLVVSWARLASGRVGPVLALTGAAALVALNGYTLLRVLLPAWSA